MSRLKVYISGPITQGDRNDNFHQAAKIEVRLMKAGYAPLNPMRSMIMPHAWDESIPHSMWLACDLPWVAAADAVFRLPGDSTGADMECDHARSLHIPVFRNMLNLEDWRATILDDLSLAD